MSELLALGISHKTAPVALRERLAFTESEAVRLAQQMTADRGGARGGGALHVQPHRALPRRRRGGRGSGSGRGRRAGDARPTTPAIGPAELAREIYSPRNCDAARHLYRVTAGLESMIVGEAEIQGQVKRAFEAALQAGCTGPLSNRLWSAALTHGQARALGDRDRLQPRERPLRRGRARRGVAAAADLARAPRT